MKKIFALLTALVVLFAAVWLCIISFSPAKPKPKLSLIDRKPSVLLSSGSAVQLSLPAGQPASLTPSPTPRAAAADSQGSPTPSPTPKPVQSALPEHTPASQLATISSPPLVAPVSPPPDPSASVAATKQQVAAQNDSNEASNFEPTTLTVMRTFVLTLPNHTQVEQRVTIPVLYRRGSIALKSDQLDQLGAIQAQVQRIVDANEELRVAADLLIARQRKVLEGGVPTEALSARSVSLLPGTTNLPGANYVNVPQGAVEVSPATKQP